MGHDISGFKTNDLENEIAYLRRCASDNFKSTIYNALDCNEFNGGVSGYGDGRKFSKNEIINALNYIGTNEEYESERRFLADCLANIDSDGNVIIYFG